MFRLPAVIARRRARTRPSTARRPALERLETLTLLNLTPVAGQYTSKQYGSRVYSGLADFAVYDSSTASFNVAANDGAPSQDRFTVQIGDPSHQNVPLAGKYFYKNGGSGYYAGLDDFAIYDVNTSTFYAAPNDGNPGVGRIAVQVGNPAHHNVPLIGEYFNKDAGTGQYDKLADFAVYDVTTATFHIAPNSGHPNLGQIAVQVGNPAHANSPIVGNYSNFKSSFYNNLDDFAIYDHTTDTYHVDVNDGTPYVHTITVQVGDPTHTVIPLAANYSAFKSPLYTGLFDFATYDQTTSTFNIDVNNGDPYNNKLAVQLGDPTHANLPLLAEFSSYKLRPYIGLADFGVYDQTTATYHIDANNGAPYQTKIAIQIGDPTHVNLPVVARFSNFKGLLYQGLDDFNAFDATTASFHVNVNNGDPYNYKLAVQLGNPLD